MDILGAHVGHSYEPDAEPRLHSSSQRPQGFRADPEASSYLFMFPSCSLHVPFFIVLHWFFRTITSAILKFVTRFDAVTLEAETDDNSSSNRPCHTSAHVFHQTFFIIL